MKGLFLFIPIILSLPIEKKEIIIRCELENKPIIGASLYVKYSEPVYQVYTNLHGYAELELKEEKTILQIDFMGPRATFTIEQPVDSVYVNFDKKKAVFYNGAKKRVKG